MLAGPTPAISKEQEQLHKDEVSRGSAAERIFNDPLLRAAIEAVKDAAWRQFAASAVDDDRTRLLVRLKLQVLAEVQDHLKTHIATGRLAAESLSQFEKFKEWMRRKKVA